LQQALDGGRQAALPPREIEPAQIVPVEDAAIDVRRSLDGVRLMARIEGGDRPGEGQPRLARGPNQGPLLDQTREHHRHGSGDDLRLERPSIGAVTHLDSGQLVHQPNATSPIGARRGFRATPE
jgi:hypothetical protein